MPLPYIGPTPASGIDVATKAYVDLIIPKQATINIGSIATRYQYGFVVDAQALSTSKCTVSWGALNDTSENGPEMDDVTFTISAINGAVVIFVVSNSFVLGSFNIQYQIFN
jgi:hypothetical protein